jgi:hypothetical protein
MPLGVHTETDPDEQAALEALRDPSEAPLPGDDDAPEVAETQPAAEKSAEKPAVEEKPAETDKPKGKAGQALRASRIAEQKAREAATAAQAERDALKAELDTLKAKAPQSDEDDMSDEEIASLESDFPLAAKAAKLAKKLAAQMKAQPVEAKKEAPKADPDFEPPILPADLQAIVDQNDDLLDWQHDPDQTRFQMATAADGLLSRHPKWKDKPLQERFAEVVRRVNAELAEAPAATKDDKDVAALIDAAPRRTAKSVGEIGGGGGKQPLVDDVSRFRSMSAEDVEAELMTRG